MSPVMMPPVPDTVTETQVEVAPDVSLRVLRAGSGQPLVLVPGWTCTADFFVHQLTGLAEHFDVIAYDPRGHGGSSKPLTGNDFTTRGHDLARLLDALDLRDVALAGWSFGVLDALSYVRDHGTGRLSSLLIVDETPRVPADPHNPEEWGEAVLAHDGIVAFLQAMVHDREEFWRGYAAYMLGLGEDTAEDHPDIARVMELGLQTPQHVAVATGADGLTSDLSEAARRAAESVPTLLVAREDWAEDAERWTRANLPTAEFATMPTHMGFVVDPEGFNATVRDFVAGAGTSA